MKRMIPLMLALALLAGCGMMKPTETPTPTEEPEMLETRPLDASETVMPEVPEMEEPKVADALDAIRDYDPEHVDSAVMRYAAAAKLLTFCKNTERTAEDLKDEIRAYFKDMSDTEKADFRERYEDVAALAQSIARGDVEQSELDTMLRDTDVKLEELDPVTFQHENLTDLDETIRDAVK